MGGSPTDSLREATATATAIATPPATETSPPLQRPRDSADVESAPASAACVTVWQGWLPSDWTAANVGHERAHVVLVLGGAFEQADEARRTICGVDDMRISPGGDRGTLRTASRGAHCLVVEAPPSNRSTLGARTYRRDPDAAALMRLIATEVADPAACPLMAELLALELFSRLSDSRGPQRTAGAPRWLADVKAVVRDQMRAPPSLDELAGMTGHHPVYLARAFRAHAGISIGGYRRRAQLQRARELLLYSSESLSGIALLAGFSDQSHMTRLFRRHLAVTPLQVRVTRGLAADRLQPDEMTEAAWSSAAEASAPRSARTPARSTPGVASAGRA